MAVDASSLPVAIVGAGPAGAGLALLLALRRLDAHSAHAAVLAQQVAHRRAAQEAEALAATRQRDQVLEQRRLRDHQRRATAEQGGARREAQGATPLDIVWTKLPWPEGWGEAKPARGYVAGGHLMITFPSPDGGLQIAWVILKGSYGELKSRGIEDWVREMANHTSGDLAAHLRANAERLTRPFLLSAVTDRVHGWARPGALVIGDAAHTMSPVGGQGINLALRDAIVAANRLVPALRAGADTAALDAAAAEIEPERGPEIDRIQTLAAQPPRLVLARGVLPRLARRLLPFLLRLPLARAGVGRTGALFLHGVTEVKLLV